MINVFLTFSLSICYVQLHISFITEGSNWHNWVYNNIHEIETQPNTQ